MTTSSNVDSTTSAGVNDADAVAKSHRVCQEPDGTIDLEANLETAGVDFFTALDSTGFDMNTVKSMTMGQLASTFMNETNTTSSAVAGHGAATVSGNAETFFS